MIPRATGWHWFPAWRAVATAALIFTCAAGAAAQQRPSTSSPPAAAVSALAAPSTAPAAQPQARGAGPFDIAFWSDLAEALPAEGQRLAGLLSLWEACARRNSGAAAAL